MSIDEPGSDCTGPAGFSHVPVLLEEAIDLLDIRPGLTYVDATCGAGGHLSRIVERVNGMNISDPRTGGDGMGSAIGAPLSDGSKVIAIDRDMHSLSIQQQRFGAAVQCVQSNFADIDQVIAECGLSTVSGGIIADLGVSSMQIDDPDRGFSFSQDGPLDMRMDTTQSTTASDLINGLSERELADIIFKYGEERHSRRIARGIVQARPIRTTLELATVIKRSTIYRPGKDSIHPATRTFQAIRIAVNEEMKSLEKFLRTSINLLSTGGRLVVISFHSLEDRMVKQIFRDAASSCVCPPRQPLCTCHHKSEFLIITRKPVVAAKKEVLANIRSRSAKLRAGQKLD